MNIADNEGPSRAKRVPCLFLSHDHTLNPFLDDLAGIATAWGVEVVRGPTSLPGVIADIDESGLEGFARADVAMFSSRSKCTRAMMHAAPNLRAIFAPTIGVESIDVAAATELDILVANGAAAENYVSMAEASIMLMLNLLYGLRTTQDVLLKNKPRPAPDQLHARMLQGKTVGIVGFGQIGREVARRLEPFGVRMLAFSPHADPSAVPEAVSLVDLETVMKNADIVGLFLAITPANRGIITDRALRMMKPTAYLINVARGSAVDEAALVRSLQERRIMGAALDTFETEPLPADSPLRSLDNVILTPHSVGHTQEMYAALHVTAVENLRRLLRSELPLYCKNPEISARWADRIRRLPDPFALPVALM